MTLDLEIKLCNLTTSVKIIICYFSFFALKLLVCAAHGLVIVCHTVCHINVVITFFNFLCIICISSVLVQINLSATATISVVIYQFRVYSFGALHIVVTVLGFLNANTGIRVQGGPKNRTVFRSL